MVFFLSLSQGKQREESGGGERKGKGEGESKGQWTQVVKEGSLEQSALHIINLNLCFFFPL